jgi:hypothetical protein
VRTITPWSTWATAAGVEVELQARERRVHELQIRALEPHERQRLLEPWGATQARFVDRPSESVHEADGLIREVVQARGLPVADFERQAAGICVIHPEVVPDYRSPHAIAVKNDRDGASPEELRQAMVHYRSLLQELLEDADARPAADARSASERKERAR